MWICVKNIFSAVVVGVVVAVGVVLGIVVVLGVVVVVVSGGGGGGGGGNRGSGGGGELMSNGFQEILFSVKIVKAFRLFNGGGAQWVESIWNRRVEYWAIRLSARSFARTAHSFTWSALLASLAALICSLAHSLPSSWERDSCLQIECVFKFKQP